MGITVHRAACLRTTLRLVLAAVLGVAVVATVPITRQAVADTAPPEPATPLTVSADALPTVQVNGVVWAQVAVGNTVYATGSFTQAWPAGATRGAAGTVAVSNLIAYDVTTGDMVTSFQHTLDAQGLTVAASPDGRRVYVGGDFTTVDGIAHDHIVAFDTATGAIASAFNVDVSAEVTTISATNSTVYAGGAFFNVNGHSRARAAALAASNGALLSWRPTIDDNNVTAMLIAPDQSRLIIAGHFTSVNSTPAYGIVAVDPVTGATMSWNSSFPVRNAGDAAAITSLSTDGTQLYGTGYVFGDGGNLEGRFASDFYGNIAWIDSCHGDTYSSYPMGQVLYSVGHSHDCSDIGLWDDMSPWIFRRAVAETTYPTGTLAHNNNSGYFDFYGSADSTQLYWYPLLAAGTFTGADQAAWSVTGNGSYIALGGEFPRVNGVAQSGLVRFAVKALAPNKTLPVTLASTNPTVASTSAGIARVDWGTTYDYDNLQLTYSVYRDGGSTPIYSVTRTDPWWNLPVLSYTDTGLVPGSTHTYQVKVFDPFGNKHPSTVSAPLTIAGSTTPTAYIAAVTRDGVTGLWRLGEASGPIGFDSAGSNDLVQNTGVTYGASGPVSGDPTTASTFNGSSTGAGTSANQVTARGPASVEAWVKTTSTRGGQVVGMGNAPAPSANNTVTTSSSYDRQLYMDNSGHFVFTVNDGSRHSVKSAAAYNNGAYHHVVGAIGANGLFLYVDGQVVGRDQTITNGNDFTGYWHIGGDNTSGLPSKGTSNFLSATIADVAVYGSALNLAQVQQRYLDSGRTLSIPPTPTDAYGSAVYNDLPDLYWRVNDTSGTTAADSSRNNMPGSYTTLGVTKNVAGAFPGSGMAVTFDGSRGNLASSSSVVNPQVYSEELWFKTTTRLGGKLIGFGSSKTSTSSNVDRHVYMTNSGQLVFGAYAGTQVTITSPKSYNDGTWHYLVATQGGNGMRLYVDGVLLGSNANTTAQNYTGYWRVGGDKVWSGASSANFAGTIDEVAIYPYELSVARVVAHYDAAGGNVAPVAGFTASCIYRSCTFDSSTTGDADGTIASYRWAFGDGATSTAASPAHLYPSAGTDIVTLTVTDDKGAAASASQQVTVTSAPAPTAAFSKSCVGLDCQFDGTSSSSPVSIASYAWDFGDGETSAAAQPSHRFSSPGTYQVKLTVTDAQGGTASVAQAVTVTNAAPVAGFTVDCRVLDCSFDGSSSVDPDGSIADYVWDFGDGTTGSGVSPTHTYETTGSYTVTLTVTDDKGATSRSTKTANAVNAAPSARFVASCTALSCSFDGTASSDSDGSIAGYAWDLGDGATDTGATTTHGFPAAGDYTVTLMVTDNLGATDTTTATVTVRPPANPDTSPYATDSFNRTVSNGFGTADSGGSWVASGNAANMSVSTTKGADMALSKAGASPGGYLNGVSSTDTDVTTTTALDAVGNGGGTYVYVVGRRTALYEEYRGVIHVLANGTVNVGLTTLDGSATAVTLVPEAAVPGLVYAAGTCLRVRLQVTGMNPTTVRMRVWVDGTTEPTAWRASATDSSPPLQAAGTVGLAAYLSGSATNFPLNALFTALQAGPSNTPPSAGFTAACTGVTCTVDASGSSDVQRDIASYTWSFGDGVTGTGVMATHTFAAAGSYRITLTVTDSTGLTDVATRAVTVTAP